MAATKPRLLCPLDLSISPAGRRLLEQYTELTVIPADRDQVLAEIAGYDAYFASLHVQFDQECFARAERLRYIATSTTGTDHLDLAEAARRGIQVLTLKEETEFLDSVTATAELAWGLLLAAARRIPAAAQAAHTGYWARDAFRGHQLSQQTCGILGYGRLGRIVAEYAKAFRMRVIACDVRPFSAPGVEAVDFDTLLAESDVLSIHIHLTPENRGLIDAAAFAKLKLGAVLVNTSRGAIIDEAALLAALESGRLRAAGLDVIDGEWRDDLVNHPLIRYAREHDNLVITPHVGGVTVESQDMTLQFTARKLLRAMGLLD